MKKYILLIATLATMLSINAKTIHWITFIDTTDPDVGKWDVLGREQLYNRYINLINAALDEKGYNHVLHDYYGARTSPENCKSVVENLSTSPDDLIMFYYIGHGVRAYNDATRWPQMALAQDYDSKLVPLSWVHSTLKNKPHRLLVTIGMCCNSEANISPKSAPTFTANYGNTFMSNEASENIARLFLGQKGDILLSSSSPKEPSRAIYIDNNREKAMDVFTHILTEIFSKIMDGSITPDWDTFFKYVGDRVNTIVNECYHENQIPQWESNLGSAEVPDNSVAQQSSTPVPTSEEIARQQTSSDNESTDERDKIINWFNTSFNLMLNRQLSDEKRVDFAEAFLSRLPDTDIQVRTLGQDSEVVVGRQSLEDFVGRLTTSRVLRGVSVAKINERGIFVREIYQQ